jgi:hypothetical protein
MASTLDPICVANVNKLAGPDSNGQAYLNADGSGNTKYVLDPSQKPWGLSFTPPGKNGGPPGKTIGVQMVAAQICGGGFLDKILLAAEFAGAKSYLLASDLNTLTGIPFTADEQTQLQNIITNFNPANLVAYLRGVIAAWANMSETGATLGSAGAQMKTQISQLGTFAKNEAETQFASLAIYLAQLKATGKQLPTAVHAELTTQFQALKKHLLAKWASTKFSLGMGNLPQLIAVHVSLTLLLNLTLTVLSGCSFLEKPVLAFSALSFSLLAVPPKWLTAVTPYATYISVATIGLALIYQCQFLRHSPSKSAL